MALVTICKYRRAKTPYFLEQAGLNMYSLEELAWFLYHNICLAEPQMFDDRLCRWLEEEIGSSELARRIRNGKESGTNFQNLVISIVGAVDLFTNQELAELGEQLKSLGTMQEQERLKLRADGLLNSRNEWAAAEEYRRILRMHQNTRLGVEFYAAVWNNLGICYVTFQSTSLPVQTGTAAHSRFPDCSILPHRTLRQAGCSDASAGFFDTLPLLPIRCGCSEVHPPGALSAPVPA